MNDDEYEDKKDEDEEQGEILSPDDLEKHGYERITAWRPGSKVKKTQSAKSQARLRERDKANGLVQVTVRAPLEDRDRLRELARSRREGQPWPGGASLSENEPLEPAEKHSSTRSRFLWIAAFVTGICLGSVIF